LIFNNKSIKLIKFINIYRPISRDFLDINKIKIIQEYNFI